MTQTPSIPATVNANPLFRHFRQPSIYIKLTSNGEFWKNGSLELPVTGEIPVYPMTARDEITLRTPDALINGTSVVNVIQSCCPHIKNAWDMPSIDVDSTLIAIRIASYGPKMSISSKCPNADCNEEHDFEIDLQDALARIRSPDYNQTIITKDGLTIKFKPLNYLQVSRSSVVQFEEQKLIQAMSAPGIAEDVRKINYDKHIQKLIELNNNNVADCTACIIADGIEVTDETFIREYYQNTNGMVLRDIQDKIKEFADAVSLRPVDVTCPDCNTQFKLNIEFDYARFFAKGF